MSSLQTWVLQGWHQQHRWWATAGADYRRGSVLRWQAGWQTSISDAHFSQWVAHTLPNTRQVRGRTESGGQSEIRRCQMESRQGGRRGDGKNVQPRRAIRSRSSSYGAMSDRERQSETGGVCVCMCVCDRLFVCVCVGNRAGWTAKLESVQRNMERCQWKTARKSGGGLNILTEPILQCITAVSPNETPSVLS